MTTYIKRLISLMTVFAVILGIFTLVPDFTINADEATPLSASDIASGKLPASGNYILSENITVTQTTTLSGDLTIDLNGYEITVSGCEGFAFSSDRADTLTINDSSAAGTGKITGNDTNRLVVIKVNCAVVLNSGTISHFTSDEGGAIKVNGNRNNSSLYGTFVMNGGCITNCYASKFGGAVSLDTGGCMVMLGGTISNNASIISGGGVRVQAGKFYMTGGSIEYNNVQGTSDTDSGGGGIIVATTVHIGGTAVIDNNTAFGITNNCSFKSGGFIFTTDSICSQYGITSLAFQTNARFGLTYTGNNMASAISTTNLPSDYASHMFSDSVNYTLTLNGSKLGFVQSSDPASLAGYKLLLDEGNIGFCFYVYMSDCDPDICTVTFEGVEGAGVSSCDNVGGETIRGVTYYPYTLYVNPSELTAPISATLNTPDGDIQLSTGITVRDYAAAIINGNYSDSAKALAKAILNFGAACQGFFNSSNPLANDLSGYGNGLTTGAVSSTLSNMPEFTVPDAGSHVRYYGTSLIINSRPVVRHYFVVTDDTDISEITVSRGKRSNLIESGDLRYFYVDIEDVDPWQYNDSYTVTVSCSGSEDIVLNYRVRNYFYSLMNNATLRSNTALYNACCAMDDYYSASVAYRGA